ncbi:MAG: Rne/Rng family ribonuclease [Firmicutes bacterium]|nr:Rne/Rng family ribonuclease [Bacillota bacterium]
MKGGAYVKEIVIHVCEEETWVALLEKRSLVELYIERSANERIVGNIYRGRVENVLPGMQAAFVNIGLERNAFLYVDDARPRKRRGSPAKKRAKRSRAPINRILQPGQKIVVQVVKEPIGSKGARVTTHITLPGRNLVLMPHVDYAGVSRRIADEKERERLRELVEELRPRGMGLIVRTAAEGKEGTAQLREDMEFLQRLWARIRRRMRKGPTPALLYKDLDLVYRIMRDLYTDDIDRVTVDNREVLEKMLYLLDIYAPHLKERVFYYAPEQDILLAYGLEAELEKALKRRVWLKSGGYLVIDQTEALTAIDVNTGKYVGTTNLADTVLRTNLEAAREIARQLRLRNVGGIIIIDFIDMDTEEAQTTVLTALEKELAKDKVKARVLGLTQLGLVEMTRKKVRQPLANVLMKYCPNCGGKGRVLTEETVALLVKRRISRLLREGKISALLVEVHSTVAAYLIGSGGSNLEKLEEYFGIPIYIKGQDNLHIEDISLKTFRSEAEMAQYSHPVSEGERVILRVEEPHISNPRDGISRIHGYVIDIEGAGDLVGQRLNLEITKVFRTYAKARVLSKVKDVPMV